MPSTTFVPLKTKGQPFFTAVNNALRGRRIVVDKDWRFNFKGETFLIPKGFDFDGASVPRIFWTIQSPIDVLYIPGIIHDFAYKYNHLIAVNEDGEQFIYKKNAGRKYWDKLFREIGIEVNGLKWLHYFAWLTLYCFGFMAWNAHRKKK